MNTNQKVRATVVWADAREQVEVEVVLPAGATLADAVRVSHLASRTGLPVDVPLDLGVHNHPRAEDSLLREGDRVEIYRPLTIDPKDARRIRADVRRRRKGGIVGSVG